MSYPPAGSGGEPAVSAKIQSRMHQRAWARRFRLSAVCIVAVAGLGIAAWYRLRYFGPMIVIREPIGAPAMLATWPWPSARREQTHPGATHWLDRSSADGTVLDLFEFDFRRNPQLALLLFDQDQDDARPFDDRAAFWERGVAPVAKMLNEQGNGIVIAAANGPFFGFTRTGRGGVASHVAPVVI